jgi:hypothetical protein
VAAGGGDRRRAAVAADIFMDDCSVLKCPRGWMGARMGSRTLRGRLFCCPNNFGYEASFVPES